MKPSERNIEIGKMCAQAMVEGLQADCKLNINLHINVKEDVSVTNIARMIQEKIANQLEVPSRLL